MYVYPCIDIHTYDLWTLQSTTQLSQSRETRLTWSELVISAYNQVDTHKKKSMSGISRYMYAYIYVSLQVSVYNSMSTYMYAYVHLFNVCVYVKTCLFMI